MSHVYSNIVSSFLSDIDAEYGKIEKMTITCGKIHKYLWMTIDYSSRGKVILSMVNYIGNILNDTPEDTRGVSTTPAAHQLFDIVEDATEIFQKKANLFHHFVDQLLYLSKRARSEIQLTDLSL